MDKAETYKLFKEYKINFNPEWEVPNKFKSYIIEKESFIIKADSSTYRKVASQIASNNLYHQYLNTNPKYPPVYLYKNLFSLHMQNFNDYKNLWKNTEGLIFDGADEWQNKYEFIKISDLLTYRVYNNKKTILISSTNLEDNIKKKNGRSFLSLLENLKRLDIK